MALRFSEISVSATALTLTNSASTNVLLGPVDISSFEKFAILLHNVSSTLSLEYLQAQVAMYTASNIGATGAPNWYSLPTADTGLPSSLGQSAGDMTTPIANAYRYLRILGGVSATAGTSVALAMTVAGFVQD